MSSYATLQPAASKYSGLTDSAFLDYDQQVRKLWETIAAKRKQIQDLQAQTPEVATMWGQLNSAGGQYDNLMNEVIKLEGQAQELETKRENRGAEVTQQGVNTQAAGAGTAAIANENLLARNINQELQGRISRNNAQAAEAVAAVGKNKDAALGQVMARAGQAGYRAEGGTAGAMADAATDRYAADQDAIEGYRVGTQNLLLGQGEAAAKSAASLSDSIGKTSADWAAKSTSAVADTTGNLLLDVQRAVKSKLIAADLPGVQAAQGAVDTTLGTWSFKSYLDVLDTLTSHSANKSTWDQMLLEQSQPPENPYAQYETAISPLTPVAGVQSNLLAAAAGVNPDIYSSSLLNNNRSGSLL